MKIVSAHHVQTCPPPLSILADLLSLPFTLLKPTLIFPSASLLLFVSSICSNRKLPWININLSQSVRSCLFMLRRYSTKGCFFNLFIITYASNYFGHIPNLHDKHCRSNSTKTCWNNLLRRKEFKSIMICFIWSHLYISQ